ncbi:MAG: pyrroline-5-carboxylate reductase [Bacteroidota bacterium]
MKILIIGAGNMGLTYGEGFIKSHVIRKEDLYFLDHLSEKQALTQRLSVHPLYIIPGPYIAEMDVIVLSVKPQDFDKLSQTIEPYLRKDQLIFSIMAGIDTQAIHTYLKVEKIIRAMPNLPAQIGLGMTVFTTSQAVDKKDLFIAQNLLNTTGKAIYTPREELLDAATAISGSGPAFVFFFMDAMISKGVEMGFSESESQLLVEQTFLGAAQLLKQNNLSCSDWIEKVSSKGGTTEAALTQFHQQELKQKIGVGLEAAEKRSKELNT